MQNYAKYLYLRISIYFLCSLRFFKVPTACLPVTQSQLTNTGRDHLSQNASTSTEILLILRLHLLCQTVDLTRGGHTSVCPFESIKLSDDLEVWPDDWSDSCILTPSLHPNNKLGGYLGNILGTRIFLRHSGRRHKSSQQIPGRPQVHHSAAVSR